MVTLKFSNDSYVVDESDGTVHVCLEKDSITATNVTISVAAGALDRAGAKGIDYAWLSMRGGENI